MKTPVSCFAAPQGQNIRLTGMYSSPCPAKTPVRHLMEVASGLRSRIWGEDQIISQVKDAIALAREAGCTDGVLETLFRSAISAGKEVKTEVRLTAVPTSAASMAVELLAAKLGDLAGKKALVIGNGEMGRLSASLLQQAGCEVWVTLRTYRHGETIVPPGCGVVPYEERFHHMEGCDFLISATTSPHYTVTAAPIGRPFFPAGRAGGSSNPTRHSAGIRRASRHRTV